MNFKIPKLPEESKGELPSGNTKMSTQKGTLAHWVISSLSVGFTAVLFMLNQNYKNQISNLENKINRYEAILIPQLNRLEPKVQQVEAKVDTVVQHIENKDSLTIKNIEQK